MWQFSWLWFGIGVAAVVAGILMVRFYRELAENTSIGNYSRWRLAGLISLGAGLAFMANLQSFVLNWLGESLFGG